MWRSPNAPFGLLDVQGNGSGIKEERMLLDSSLAKRIRERARKLGVSPAALCHVAWAQVLAKHRDVRMWFSGLFCSVACKGKKRPGDGSVH